MPRNTIAVGDCIEAMNGWPQASVDLVFADPPYNIGFTYDKYNDRLSDDDYEEWTRDWITAAARLLKPTGSFYVLIGDEYAAEARLILKKLEKQGKLVFRNWIVWHYTFGQNCKAKFNRSHAHLFYCVGSAATGKWAVSDPPFTFNRQAIAVASARQTTYADARANPKGKLPDDTWYLRPQEAIEDAPAPEPEKPGLYAQLDADTADSAAFDKPWLFDADSDTWYLSRLCGTFKERLGWHNCQLPEALLERIIKLSSNKGDLVFDPFSGSGTTLAVAARLRRQYLGCELSEDYAAKALERIEHVKQTGQALRTEMADKGIERGKPKKKAEPKRSPHLRGGRRWQGAASR